MLAAAQNLCRTRCSRNRYIRSRYRSAQVEPAGIKLTTFSLQVVTEAQSHAEAESNAITVL